MGDLNTPALSLADVQALSAAVAAAVEAVFKSRQPGSSGQPVSSLSVRLVDAVNEYLLGKARAGRSGGHLGHLHKALSSFARGREGRPVATITSAEIEAWVNGQGWGAKTRRGYLLDVRAFLGACCRRGHLVVNPALGVDLPTVPPRAPGIHTPSQVQVVLEAARASDLDVCRFLAVRYFAGLRWTEAAQLVEENIQPGRGFLEVPAAVAKTRQRRLVIIQPALRAWLDLGGVCPLRQVNNRLAAVIAKSGVVWTQNVTRHSFVSYHLAAFGSAAKTALEAGHTEAMLFAHYRELVDSEAAARFWAIRPKT